MLSRVEPLEYSHSGKELLGAQIDAAINPGNSGGPVLHEGKVVGIAFQGLGESQNIGYMIPCSVLKHFLEDLKSGKVDGFPDVPFDYEKLENPDLREYCRMKPGQSGILVTSVPEILAEQVPLKAGDVVMKVENFNIANDATIDQGQGKVLYFGCVFWEKQLNTPCRLTILRDGQRDDGRNENREDSVPDSESGLRPRARILYCGRTGFHPADCEFHLFRMAEPRQHARRPCDQPRKTPQPAG